MATAGSYLLMILLLITAVFLIILVLIQRGKGGGLAGAFGGMGGQSAFGTKAGDLFTKVTIGVAAFWIILCIVTVKILGVSNTGLLEPMGEAGAQAPAGVSAPAEKPAEGGAVPASTPASESSTPSPESSAPASTPAAPAQGAEGGETPKS